MSDSAIRACLDQIYDSQTAERIAERVADLLNAFRARNPDRLVDAGSKRLNHSDVLLITYADMVSRPGESPLATLKSFVEANLGDAISTIHLLPFFPASSDDGFSVIDYRSTDPVIGSWEDVHAIGERYRLMFDAVINHVSRQNRWFQEFLAGVPAYRNYFIVADPAADLSLVTRPRTHPLLTPVETRSGLAHVWTTFSEDQIDLNFAEPDVLLEILDLLLFYVEKHAQVIRLDAIAYLWKEIGTRCIHHPKTHAIVRLMRSLLDAGAPDVLLITETNVPHQENVRYFGDGFDEAQLVYQFPLAPLILDAFVFEETMRLSEWAATVIPPSPATTFLNFIASHDGIGLRPAEDILPPEHIDALTERTLHHGGRLSYRTHPDGSRSVYELNISLYDFLNDPSAPLPDVDIPRFLASQAIILSLQGVPGVYFHSLFGTRNCEDCFQATGRVRSFNRKKFDLQDLEAELADPSGHAGPVLKAYLRMLSVRNTITAFDPVAPQRILNLDRRVFSLERMGRDRKLLCLVNVSSAPLSILVPDPASALEDVLSGEVILKSTGQFEISMGSYQVRWMLDAGPTGRS